MRGYSKYYYNFAQPLDTLQLEEMLGNITYLEHAAVPVLKYSQYLDPAQTASTLQKLPRVREYQLRRRGRAMGEEQRGEMQVLMGALMGHLGDRFAQVLPDCTPKQVCQGLWGLGAARVPHQQAFAKAAQLIPTQLEAYSVGDLADVAWAFMAAHPTDQVRGACAYA